MKLTGLLLLLFVLAAEPVSGQSTCVSEEERQLLNLIMEYRKTKKLPAIPYSEKLTRVAQAHVRDLAANYDYENRGDCNPHSWSDKGAWTPCCYTPDHKQSACMWNKPKEIAGYQGEGYEIAFYSSDGAEPFESLEGWKSSAGHNPLLINSGIWQKVAWKGIGIGIYEKFAVVWFGAAGDPSTIQVCPD